MKKTVVILFYLLAVMWGFINREFIFTFIKDSDESYLYLFFILSVLIATIPVIPFTIFGGLVGIKYGVAIGLAINWFGSFSAAIVYYIMARFIFANYFSRKIKQYERVEKINTLMNQNLFFSILIFRLIPIIPPLVIHIYSGVSKIPPSTYLTATGIGMIPSMLILAFGGEQIFSNFPQFILGITVYISFLLLTYFVYRGWVKGKVRFARE
jgi:uncharacterized membrane protein YdjX (TVP38/TMEM64 family)